MLFVGSLVAAATTTLACAHPIEELIGTSHPRTAAEVAETPRDGGAPRPVSPLPANFRATLRRVNASRVLSPGHAPGRFAVDLYANDAGGRAYEAERGEIEPGALLVEEHFERAAGDAGGPIMMMEKRAKGVPGGWRYVVVTASGEVVLDGASEGCSGCHDDAPHDGLFRLVDAPPPLQN